MADFKQSSFDSAFNNMEQGLKRAGQISSSASSKPFKATKKLEGFSDMIKNLNEVTSIVRVRTARTLAAIVVDLLSHSQPVTPVDSGKLRESGRATLSVDNRTFTVGKGSKAGTVEANITKITSSTVRGAKRLNANVSYFRTNEKGEDIALLMHEDLMYFKDRPTPYPAAKQPGTGPKYLENPWEEKRPIYQAVLLHDLLPLFYDDIALSSHIKKRKQAMKWNLWKGK